MVLVFASLQFTNALVTTLLVCIICIIMCAQYYPTKGEKNPKQPLKACVCVAMYFWYFSTLCTQHPHKSIMSRCKYCNCKLYSFSTKIRKIMLKSQPHSTFFFSLSIQNYTRESDKKRQLMWPRRPRLMTLVLEWMSVILRHFIAFLIIFLSSFAVSPASHCPSDCVPLLGEFNTYYDWTSTFLLLQW